jgi:hypothetical protein
MTDDVNSEAAENAAAKPADKRKPKAAAKPEKKASAKGAPREAATKRDGRYLRAARAMIAEGEDIALARLAKKAGLSEASARYCREAYLDVLQALREAGRLPAREEPKAAEAEPAAAA